MIILCSLLVTACVSLPSSPSLRGEGESASGAVSPQTEDDSPLLEIYVPYIGQGDATLIRTPSGKTLLIDAGPPGAGKGFLLPLFRQLNLSHLDALVITHYDDDHLGGVPGLLVGEDGMGGTPDDITLAAAWDRGGEPYDNSPGLLPYLEILKDLKISRGLLEAGQKLPLDPKLKIRCLAADAVVVNDAGQEFSVDLSPATYSGKENAASIALLIEYGTFRYLTAGDLTGGGMTDGFLTPDVETLLGEAAGPVDVLHVNHHGSLSSSNAAFIAATHPQAVIIQAGINNPYGHPAHEVVQRWEDSEAEVLSTAEGEGYALTTHGEAFEVQNLKDLN